MNDETNQISLDDAHAGRAKIFEFRAGSSGPMTRGLIHLFGKPLAHVIGFTGLNALYEKVITLDKDTFWENVLEGLNVKINVSDKDLARIPKKGPVVVVANHPFGAIEGLALGTLMHRARPDCKFLGNFFLSYIPDIRPEIIPVDPFGKKSSLSKNIRPLRECLEWLREDHALSVFPAGEVAHLNLRKRSVTDPRWSPTIGRIVRRTKAPVVPVFFQGHNGPLFQIMGMLHPRFRTLMLPRQMLNKKRSTLDISVGSLIPFRQLANFGKDNELMAYLRLRTYMLKKRSAPERKRKLLPKFIPRKAVMPVQDRDMEPIHAPMPPEDMAREIAALNEDQMLAMSGKFQVFMVRSEEIPVILQEIGRLREFTFRQVGEGTGKSIDLDEFDDYYLHLFIWNKEDQEVIGAYRVGRTDDIIAEHGIDGLYTSTLFTFKPALFEKMGKGLEMGRSFVRPEYQKSFSALLLLWKAIGKYVLINPDHKTLFGPVSISKEYSAISRELIVRYFKTHDYISEYAKLAKPKRPPKFKTLKRYEIREFSKILSSTDELTEVISDMETDTKGIPILLKQYLKLGGKVLTFNVDPDFGDCIDGLIFVDLSQTPHRVLGQYMGKENAENFFEYHAIKAAKAKEE